MSLLRTAAKTRRLSVFLPAVLLAAGLASPAGFAAEKAAASAPRLGPLEKSLIAPGWGQVSEGRVLKGVAFAAAELACLAGFLHHNRLGNSSYDLYKAATDAASAGRYRDLVERHDGRRNAYLLAAAAVWAANLLDIHLIILRRDGAEKAATLSVGASHGPWREMCLSLGCRF